MRSVLEDHYRSLEFQNQARSQDQNQDQDQGQGMEQGQPSQECLAQPRETPGSNESNGGIQDGSHQEGDLNESMTSGLPREGSSSDNASDGSNANTNTNANRTSQDSDGRISSTFGSPGGGDSDGIGDSDGDNNNNSDNTDNNGGSGSGDENGELPPLFADVVHDRVMSRMAEHMQRQRNCARRIGRALRVELGSGLLTLDTVKDEFQGLQVTEVDRTMVWRMDDDDQEEEIDTEWTMYGWTTGQRPFSTWADVHEARAQPQDDGSEDYDYEEEDQPNEQVEEETEPNSNNYAEWPRNSNSRQPYSQPQFYELVEAARTQLRLIREPLTRPSTRTSGDLLPASAALVQVSPELLLSSQETPGADTDGPDTTSTTNARWEITTDDAYSNRYTSVRTTPLRHNEHSRVETPTPSIAVPSARNPGTSVGMHHHHRAMGNNVINHFQGGIHYHYASAPCCHSACPHSHSRSGHGSGDNGESDSDSNDDNQDNLRNGNNGHTSYTTGSASSIYGTPRSQFSLSGPMVAMSSDTEMDGVSSELGDLVTSQNSSLNPSTNSSNTLDIHQPFSYLYRPPIRVRAHGLSIGGCAFSEGHQWINATRDSSDLDEPRSRNGMSEEEHERIDHWMIKYRSELARAREEHPEDHLEDDDGPKEVENSFHARYWPFHGDHNKTGKPVVIVEEHSPKEQWIRELHWKEARLNLEGRRGEARELKKKRQALWAFMRSKVWPDHLDRFALKPPADVRPDRHGCCGNNMPVRHGRIAKRAILKRRQALGLWMKRKRASSYSHVQVCHSK
ncbi:hypothetical protein BGX34_008368 [Mortierella sp. NVP85]|nr:hypothetical protein BGX34_008368 [Mortierella sp. NVP85]